MKPGPKLEARSASIRRKRPGSRGTQSLVAPDAAHSRPACVRENPNPPPSSVACMSKERVPGRRKPRRHSVHAASAKIGDTVDATDCTTSQTLAPGGTEAV